MSKPIGGISPGCPEHDSRCRPGHCVVATGEAQGPAGFRDQQLTAMSTARQMLPPPFPPAKDEVTQPGLGQTPREAQLMADAARLRRERNQAIKERDAALLGSSAPGTSSVPPPTRKQKTVRGLLTGTKWATLLLFLPAVGAAVAKHWPDYADIVNTLISVIGQ